jgi:penicillin-binding protein 1C
VTLRSRRLVWLAAWVLGLAAIPWIVPKPELLPAPRESGSRAIFDDRGRLLRLTLAADEEYRLWVPLAGISPTLVEATLLQEDRHFRSHPGVNPLAIARAGWETYVRQSRRMGGSTVTMQLARLRWNLATDTPKGKLVQMLRALQLELHYSKDEILEAYLNLAPYGGNVQGVGAASFIYFSKSPKDLTLAEALTLAVVPQNPVHRGPSGGSPALAKARAALFARWLAAHPADQDKEIYLASVKIRTPGELPFLAPHFVDDELSRGHVPPEMTTTLDLDLQRVLERQVKQYVDASRSVGLTNASAMLVDWRTMEVKALVGSADWFDASIQGQVDGTDAPRSPGSTLKPFVYALAFQQGLIHPKTMLKDSPVHFAAYSPENADGTFAGPVSAADALVRSRNVPAVEVASQLRGDTLYTLLKKSGIANLHDEEWYGLSLVLGGAEVTMRDEARLYAALANGGKLRALRTRATDPLDAGLPILTPESAFLALDVLSGNPRPGQAQLAWSRGGGLEVAWKTGTSHGFRDAWSVGVAGPYVLAVWVGNFDGRGNPAFVGVRAAAPLFFRVVDAIRSRPEVLATPSVHPDPRANLARVEVCAISGGLPQPWCPHRVSTWFIPGVSPVKVCDLHRKVAIDPATGNRACDPNRPGLKSAVYEFWPSDLLELFREAGIPRRVPPPSDPKCPLSDLAAEGVPPSILSPRGGVVYTLQSHDLDRTGIEFSAVADADVREIYWFLDDRLVGTSRNGETLSWAPSSGSWVVRAVDDHGRGSSRELTVSRVN